MQFSFLKKEDEKKLRQNRSRQNSGGDNEGKPVLLLEVGESIKTSGKIGVRVIRDEESPASLPGE